MNFHLLRDGHIETVNGLSRGHVLVVPRRYVAKVREQRTHGLGHAKRTPTSATANRVGSASDR